MFVSPSVTFGERSLADAITVVAGIHHMYTLIDVGQLAKFGYTYWLPLPALPTWPRWAYKSAKYARLVVINCCNRSDFRHVTKFAAFYKANFMLFADFWENSTDLGKNP